MRWILLIAALLLEPFAEAEEALLRVATYNLRNHLCMDRLLESGFRRDYPKPESEKRVVVETIRAVKPDLLMLQEVGGPLYLEELRQDLKRTGLEYPGSAIVEGPDEARRVAALWRQGLDVEATAHVDLGFTYLGEEALVRRGMLQLDLRDSQGRVWASFFNLHLKSKYTTDPRDPQAEERRVGEARAARNRVLSLHPQPDRAQFLILGDLNDGPFSRSLQRFKKKGDLPIARLIDSRDAHGLSWTHDYRKGGMYSQIDHMLASEGWSRLHRLTATIESRPDYYQGSDHRMVWLDIPLSDGIPDTDEPSP